MNARSRESMRICTKNWVNAPKFEKYVKKCKSMFNAKCELISGILVLGSTLGMGVGCRTLS